MIKGLISLFTSGIIFNPMVLLGIVSGVYAIISFSPDKIRDILVDSDFYLAVLLISAFYTFVFARIYKSGGRVVDYSATFGLVVWNFIRCIIAFVLAMSFVTMISIF